MCAYGIEFVKFLFLLLLFKKYKYRYIEINRKIVPLYVQCVYREVEKCKLGVSGL